jgi:myosin-15
MREYCYISGKFDSHTSRQFPPTVLEWRANKKRVNLALEAKSSDGDARHGAVDSFTTAEEFAANILQVRSVYK